MVTKFRHKAIAVPSATLAPRTTLILIFASASSREFNFHRRFANRSKESSNKKLSMALIQEVLVSGARLICSIQQQVSAELVRLSNAGKNVAVIRNAF